MDIWVSQKMDVFYARPFLLLVYLSISAVSSEDVYQLNDGNEIPVIALGTSLGHLADGTRILSVNHTVARAVQWALESGYRHVDTAAVYRVEDDVGLGLANYLADNNANRTSVYITTKLYFKHHERKAVPVQLRKSLKKLQLDYVDLYLMHFPFGYNKDDTISNIDYLTTWKGMEDAKDLNLTKSIGVCNFNITQMQRLWDNSRIKPAVLQIEVNPTITQEELIKWCEDHGIVVMAYSPFGAILGRKPDAPPPRIDHPLLKTLAIKYKKTVPQILIRYLLDLKLIPIPRSVDKDHIQNNIDVFDFTLTSEEVKQVSQFNSDYRLRTRTYIKFYRHPYFPFPKLNVTDVEIQSAIDNIKED